MKVITSKTEELRSLNAGAKIYGCPWCNTRGADYWKVYGHALLCGIPHGYYSIPLSLVLRAFGL